MKKNKARSIIDDKLLKAYLNLSKRHPRGPCRPFWVDSAMAAIDSAARVKNVLPYAVYSAYCALQFGAKNVPAVIIELAKESHKLPRYMR